MGGTIQYRCPTGSVTLGPTTRTCQTDGLWSQEAPTCKRNQPVMASRYCCIFLETATPSIDQQIFFYQDILIFKSFLFICV
jgi:hypothetical protein